ncbi:MAG TPA: phosphate ABC transporter permease subunit PstC [Candidatus Limnocylindrales bacterium]
MTTTTWTESAGQAEEIASPRQVRQLLQAQDRAFRGISRAGGVIVLAIMVLVGAYLTINAIPAIAKVGVWEFLSTAEWSPATFHFGVAELLTGTVLIAMVALCVGFPLSLGTALFITEIAGDRLRTVLTSVTDLMAAIPSVIFGLFGLAFLEGKVAEFSLWISTWLGWFPPFHVDGADPSNPLPNPALYSSSTFIAGIVVGVMIVPVMTSMMRESFSRAPIGEREGAFALGATRWGMIRTVVLPYGRGGIIGGTMLGMGRALGETIAIYLIISPTFVIQWHVLQKDTNSIAAHIALNYGEANPFAMSALMAAGLTLFLLTMVINFTASTIIARSRSGAESEA